MKLNKYTLLFILLAISSNFLLTMWLKQGLLGVIMTIIFLLIAAWTTKQPNTDDQHK